MDEENQESSIPARHRSPTFNENEVKALLNLIDKYKTIVFNKSTTASACHARDVIWNKIMKEFNKHDFKNKRTASCLKVKFENLKRDIRSRSRTRNIINIKYGEFSEVSSQLLSLMHEAENNTSVVVVPLEDDATDLEKEKNSVNDSDKIFSWEDEANKQTDLISEECNESGKKVSRSLNFSHQECRLLLQCVRGEKHVLSKNISNKSLMLKRRAWNRITEAFNKISSQKRSMKVLRTKFSNMKKLARNVGFSNYVKKYYRKNENMFDNKEIKSEPLFEYNVDVAPGPSDEDDDYIENNDLDKNRQTNDGNQADYAPDPLCTVLNSDSGLGSITESHKTHSEEIAKLKIELLKYKMENAKLERKRLEEAMLADAAERECRAVENSLRLRAARLAVAAEELKLPASHPALHENEKDESAQRHLHNYPHM